MKQFTMEELKQPNAYVILQTGAGTVFMTRQGKSDTWVHSVFKYTMSSQSLLESMNSGLYSAELHIAKEFDNDYASF
jgi:hypothetical protein